MLREENQAAIDNGVQSGEVRCVIKCVPSVGDVEADEVSTLIENVEGPPVAEPTYCSAACNAMQRRPQHHQQQARDRQEQLSGSQLLFVVGA